MERLYATLVVLALQQGVPGQVTTPEDASGGAANVLMFGILAVFLVLALVMAFSYVKGRETPNR